MSTSRFHANGRPGFWITGTLALCLACAVIAGDVGLPRMATYQLGILKRGPSWTPTVTAAVESIQAGHMANIQRMSDEGVLVGAGPFLDGGPMRGLVRAGRMVVEMHSWLSAWGLMPGDTL